MDKYIDADELKRWIQAECNPYGAPTLDYASSVKIMERIDKMPAEDVAPISYDGDYITKRAVRDLIESKCIDGCICNEDDFFVGGYGICDEIDDLPSADVEQVRHGRWDGEGDGYADGEIVLDVWSCSICGHCIDDGTDDPELLPDYCPACGAKMDGGNGENENGKINGSQSRAKDPR